MATSYLEYLTNRLRSRQGNSTATPTGSNPISAFKGIELPDTLGPGAFTNRLEGAVGEGSTLGKVIDVLSRPVFAVGNYAKEGMVDPLRDQIQGTRNSAYYQAIDRGDNPLNAGFNTTMGSALSGLAGRSKILPSDAILADWKPADDAHGFEKFGRFATGLGLDVGLDPIMYIPGAAIASVAKKAPGVAKAAATLRSAGTLEKQAVALPPEITEVAATAAQQGVKLDVTELAAAAQKLPSVRRTADGKRVYDVSRLPNLYARPAAAASKKPIADAPKTVTDWVNQFKNAPVAMLPGGSKLVFRTTDDADKLGLTLGTFASNAERAGNKKNLDLVQRLFDESRGVSATGTAKSTPSLAETLTVGAARAQAPSRVAELRIANREKALATLKKVLEPEDYTYLTRSRSSATYNARRKEILSRVHSPVEPAPFTDAATDAIRATIKPVAITKPIMASDPVVESAVSHVARKQLIAPNHPYRTTGKGTKRSATQMGRGTGVSDRGMNKRAQYEAFKIFTRKVSATLKGTGLSGDKRAAVMASRVAKLQDEFEAVLRSHGLEPILGSGNKGIPLSFGDMIKAIMSSPKGTKAALIHIFDLKPGSVAITNISDAYELLLHTMRKAGITDIDEAVAYVRSLRAMQGEKGSLFQQMTREITKDPRGAFTKSAEASERAAASGTPDLLKGVTTRRVDKGIRTVDGVKKKVHPTTQYTESLGGAKMVAATREILDAMTSDSAIKAIVRAASANSERYGVRLGQEIDAIADDVVSEFTRAWTSGTTSTGEAIATYGSLAKAVNASSDARGAMPASRATAQDVVRNEIDDIMGPDADGIVRMQRILASNDSVSLQRAAQANHNAWAREAEDAMSTASLLNKEEAIEVVVDHAIIRGVFPFLSRQPNNILGRTATGVDHVLEKLIPQTGHATLRPAVTSMGSAVRNLANGWRDVLTQIHKVFPNKETLVPMMIKLQRGEDITGQFTKQQQRAVDQLTHLTRILFETNSSRQIDSATGIFFRNAAEIEHINAKLSFVKLAEHMRFDPDKAILLAKQENIPVRQALANQWKDWKIDDPVDFLARVQKAAISTIGDQAITREGLRIAVNKGLASSVRREGFVQIKNFPPESVMARYLPQNGWYHPDIVDEFRAVDRVLSQSLTFDSPFGQYVHKYLDPLLNMWKSGMTIYRPGHHVRNFVGDTSLSYYADGVPKIHQARNAMKIMGMRGNYDDWSALKALQTGTADVAHMTEEMLLRGNSVVATVKLRNGTTKNLTAKEVHDYTRSRGMLPDFVSGEDLIRNADNVSPSISAIQDAMQVAGGRVRRIAGRTSEARDDFVRLQHFLQIVEKNRSFNSLDELMDFAVRRVRKWHPDGTDLTAFETKVMRRLVPFYSWNKKTMPLIVESMLMQPGRIMVWPKATYNAAKAAGIDINSISDPFPADQLFPSFLTDDMSGPMYEDDKGRYFGVNPGFAHVDLMNQFIGDPRAASLGMITPFIKAPAELLTGSRMDTQTRIHDTSEYIGSNIPGISQGQSMSGYDILGTLLQGQGAERISAVERGNRGQLDPSAFINYLTGLGLHNMSKPSYINYAEIEARDAARKAAERR